MTKAIDVKKLSAELKVEFDEKLKADIKKAMFEAKATNISEKEFLADLAFIMKNNTEQFTISILQKVVDELSKN